MVDAKSSLRAVLYARVSELVEGRKSVGDQLAELRVWAERDGWRVVAEHRDDGVSASKFARRSASRDGWQQVMDLITAGQVDLLAVWELSRASRDRAVWAALLAACEEHQVKIAAGGKVHDPAEADDAFMVDLGAALSARESAMLSKRVRRAVRARVADGEPHGKLPYGYKFERDPDSGRALRRVPHPDTAPIVQEICRRVLAGEALYTVAADLRSRGLRSPRGAEWRPEQVRRIAVSATYAGLRTHKGEVVGPATWPALVTESDHQALVSKLTDPARKTWVDGSVKHLLVGIAVCGLCGATCRRIKNRGTPSYACSARFCVTRSQVKVDMLISALVVARLSQPDVLQLLAKGDPEAERAADEAQTLRIRLDQFYEQAAEGTLTPAGLSRVEARMLDQIKAAERRARPRGLPPMVANVAGLGATGNWERLAVPQKREIVRALLVPRIMPARHGSRAFNPALIQVDWIS